MSAQNRPTPRALSGRTAPSSRVRPVDWTATGRRDAADRRVAASDGRGETADETPSASLPASGRARTLELPRTPPAPPEDAVHTLDPADERPAPRPLQIDEGQIRTVGVRDLTSEQIVLAVADPEEAWTADAGTSDHFLRGPLVIQVRRTDNAVIGAFTRGYALSVRPEEYEDALDVALEAAGRSARKGRGTRHPTSRRELLERMYEAGFVVTPGASHGRVAHPDHPGLFVPFASTPSDVRFTRHAVAQIRRVFGIDLRR